MTLLPLMLMGDNQEHHNIPVMPVYCSKNLDVISIIKYIISNLLKQFYRDYEWEGWVLGFDLIFGNSLALPIPALVHSLPPIGGNLQVFTCLPVLCTYFYDINIRSRPLIV